MICLPYNVTCLSEIESRGKKSKYLQGSFNTVIKLSQEAELTTNVPWCEHLNQMYQFVKLTSAKQKHKMDIQVFKFTFLSIFI